MVSQYLFHEIPGAHPSWTLAVFAISLADAREYVKGFNRGGKFIAVATPGYCGASCAAVTDAARKVNRGEVL